MCIYRFADSIRFVCIAVDMVSCPMKCCEMGWDEVNGMEWNGVSGIEWT